MLLPHLADDCVVLFHDGLGWPVQNGAKVLVKAGFKFRVFRTPQLLICCWRGNYTPPGHAPDPAFDWKTWIGNLDMRIPGRCGPYASL